MITYAVQEPFYIHANTYDDILNFGSNKRNNYPHETKVISENSGTLRRCLNIWKNFVFGQGMTESGDFWKTVINANGLRVDQLLRRVIEEMKHGGVALHVGYNSNLEKCSITPFPFETIRLKNNRNVQNLEEYKYINVLKYHPNWCASYFKRDLIVEFNSYNEDKAIIARQIELAGGFDKWNGQMFYFGADGEIKYPYNRFHAVLEDCITDIYLKRGKNASASTNFMPSHILQLPFKFSEIASDQLDDNDGTNRKGEKLKNEFIETLKDFQGCEQQGNLFTIENTAVDEKGQMVPIKIDKLDLQNYDKVFELTEKTVKENIRDNFLIPEVLTVMGKGFSTDEIVNGYNYYNNITAYDRQIVEEIFMTLFRNWYKPINPAQNYAIKPLQYLQTT